MSGVFVTSSGTGIGKTLVVTTLVRQLRQRRRKVRALKPVMTGYDPAAASGSDAGQILESLGEIATEAAIERISPWRFEAPLSPDMAAAREGRTIEVDDVVAFCRRTLQDADREGACVVVEGIGGVMVPLDRHRTVRDWIAALEIPAIVVVGTYLGSLSHALTAIEALRARRCALAGVVISESADGAAPLAEVAASLAGHTDRVPIIAVPRSTRGEEHWRDLPNLSQFCS